MLIVSIYVDDIIYTGSSIEMIEDFKADMMHKYEMTDLGGKLRNDDDRGVVDVAQFRKIVGSLLYLTATGPDIMHASCLLARFMHCSTNNHCGTAKRVLRYIQGTLDYGLEYKKDQGAMLFGFCDSDWSGFEDDMRSTSGYAFTFGSGVFLGPQSSNIVLHYPRLKQSTSVQ
ncbi:secreted RxLR effector protein 161-like [Pyrus communis]|uniref:secreted RxLR effector protein 161-like n=1 Tax=Pyrus communis TaxID=23211 RepID=UPI0035C0FBD1